MYYYPEHHASFSWLPQCHNETCYIFTVQTILNSRKKEHCFFIFYFYFSLLRLSSITKSYKQKKGTGK